MSKTSTDTTNDILFGIRPLIEAIEAGREIDKVYIQKNLKGQLFKELWSYLKDYRIPYSVVPLSRIQKYTQKNHQGVIAFLSAIPTVDIENVIQDTYEKGEDPLVVILDRVSDVRNFGAIARTAHAAGAHALIIGNKQSAAVNEDAVKTSAGALHHIALSRSQNLNDTIHWLRQSGIKVVGCTEKAEQNLFQTDLKGPLAIIMGAEDKGIAPERQKLCDALVKLPMRGQVGSLNVSVAAGAMLYEVVRQRTAENS